MTTIQLTIIGMGQIGTSLGLALAKHKDLVKRIGHDKNPEVARQAEKLGALDKVEINLHQAVRGADLVILALPMDQMRETMAAIAIDLKEGAVVMDTGPVKAAVAAWAGEMIPNGRFYIGLTPVINPDYLHTPEAGIESARADLFQGGVMAVCAPPRANSEAIKLAADLTRLLGAAPFFADMMEMDGLMAATHLLPQLMAAALLNSTLEQPGWREARKVTGRAYAKAVAPLVQLNQPDTLATEAMLNRDNVLRMLDGTLAALQAIRDDLNAQDQNALEQRLTRAHQGGENWWQQRRAGDWITSEGLPAIETPSAADILGRMLGFGGRKPKK